MSFKQDLLENIRQLKLTSFTTNSLTKRLGIHTVFEKEQIEKQLKELVNESELILKQDKTFMLPDKNKYIKGVLRGNKKGFAFLEREDKNGDDLFIPNRNLNGALNKDIVYAVIVKGDEAEVVSIVERGVKNLVGTYQQNQSFGFVVPDDDSNFNDVFVPEKNLIEGVHNNSKVVVRITDYEGKNPTGKIIEVLGDKGLINTEVLSILKTYGFEDKFPTEVQNDAKFIDKEIVIGDREDYRDLLTITIDGDDAKDFDDAISLTKDNDKYTLYVHIADVTNYVPLNSKIDKEAFKRGTSVYFPSNVYPMLPFELSNEMCSLRPDEERYTLTCVMYLDKQGEMYDKKIVKSVIKSNYRMTYKKVTKILAGDNELRKEYSDIVKLLEDMQELAGILSEIRKKRGSINFITKESLITLNEKGEPIEVKPYPYEVSNGIIEEFMLIANETIAEFMFHTGFPFIYRVHEKPVEDKLKAFKQLVEGCGFKLSMKNIHPMIFSKLLDEVKGTQYDAVINKSMLRSMAKARYDSKYGSHFGLAARYYCHFTSPIRRYPDLTIHRIIKLMLEGKINDKNINKYEKFVNDAALISTERERAAENAEWDIDDYYKALFMQKHINEVYEGIISGMNNHGIFVELLNTVEGMIRAEDFPTDGGEYTYNAERFKVFNSEHCYRLGDKVKIKVTAVDDVMKKVRFVFDETEYEKKDSCIENKNVKSDNGIENINYDEEQGAV